MFARKNLRSSRSKTLSQSVDLNIADVFDDCNNVCNAPFGLSSLGRFDKVYITRPVRNVAYRFGEELYAVCDDGVYLIKESGETKLSDAPDGVCFVNSDGYLYFSSVKGGTYMVSGSGSEKVSVVGYDKMLFSNSRIFGLSGGALTVVPVDPQKDWSLAYTLRLPQPCVDLVALGNKVYLLGNECYAYECKEHAVDSRCYPVAHHLGEVQVGSAVALCSKAVFATSKGLFVLSGGSVRQVCRDITRRLCLQGAVACAFGANYLLSCKRKATDAANDITLLLDVDDGKVCGVFGVGFDSLSAFGKEVYGVRDGDAFRFVEEGDAALFKREKLDMGCQKMKYLDGIDVLTARDIKVWVGSDGASRLYTFVGSVKPRHQNICGFGRQFSVELQSETGFELQFVRLTAHAQKED